MTPVSGTLPKACPSTAQKLPQCSKNSFLTCPSGQTKGTKIYQSQQLSSELYKIVPYQGIPLPKRHVSSTTSAWYFKRVIDVANTAVEILHHNPTVYAKSLCPPTQAALWDIPPTSSILTSIFCHNPPTLCLPPTPSPNSLISYFAFNLTKEAQETTRNGTSAAPHQTDHPFVPSLRQFASWTVGRPAT